MKIKVKIKGNVYNLVFFFSNYDRKPKLLVYQNRYKQLVSFGICVIIYWGREGVSMVFILIFWLKVLSMYRLYIA